MFRCVIYYVNRTKNTTLSELNEESAAFSKNQIIRSSCAAVEKR